MGTSRERGEITDLNAHRLKRGLPIPKVRSYLTDTEPTPTPAQAAIGLMQAKLAGAFRTPDTPQRRDAVIGVLRESYLQGLGMSKTTDEFAPVLTDMANNCLQRWVGEEEAKRTISEWDQEFKKSQQSPPN